MFVTRSANEQRRRYSKIYVIETNLRVLAMTISSKRNYRSQAWIRLDSLTHGVWSLPDRIW